MGFKTVITVVSDVSGKDLAPEDVMKVSALGKRLEMSREELASMKTVQNAIELVVTLPDESTQKIVVTRAEFEKLIPKDKFEALDGSKGRRTGASPNGS